MLSTENLQQAQKIADMLSEINEKHTIARDHRPAQPDDSPEARLFSAYDAAEAAMGRLHEIVPEKEGQRQQVQPLTHPSPTLLAEELDQALQAAEELLNNLPLDTDQDTRDHLESAVARLADASGYLSGQEDPRDNPAPYEDFE